jgi:hypothetical protein
MLCRLSTLIQHCASKDDPLSTAFGGKFRHPYGTPEAVSAWLPNSLKTR